VSSYFSLSTVKCQINWFLTLFSYQPSAEILDYATTKAAIVAFTKGELI
jgi:hypothetical protein